VAAGSQQVQVLAFESALGLPPEAMAEEAPEEEVLPPSPAVPQVAQASLETLVEVTKADAAASNQAAH